jgi:hypothetical protein
MLPMSNKEPHTPRLALSKVSISAIGRAFLSRFHFHWLRASAMGKMKEALVRVVKRARNVLSVTLNGREGSGLLSKMRKPTMMTAWG